MGVQPSDPEVIHLTFDAIATRGVSLVIHTCLFFLNHVPTCPAPLHAKGSPSGQTGPSRLLELAKGPYYMREQIKGAYQINFVSFRLALCFYRKLGHFPLFLMFTPELSSF